LQGVIKSYDPSTGDGSVISDSTLAEYDLATDALDGSLFRMLRQGQRVVFEVTDGPPGAAHPAKVATTVRLGSEIDMGTPGFPDSEHLPGPAPETRTIRHEGGLS
jgi:cold shock CspA family protein